MTQQPHSWACVQGKLSFRKIQPPHVPRGTIHKPRQGNNLNSIKRWIKMWYIYTREYDSNRKKNKTMPFAATWMQPKTSTLSGVIQKDKHRMISLIRRTEDMAQGNLPPEQRRTDLENWPAVAKGAGGGELDGEVGVSRCKLRHAEWISQEALRHSTGNSIPSPG